MLRKIEKLAYHYAEGKSDLPTLVFLPGFRSDMKGLKAQYLADQCQKRSQSCLLLDYSGHGASDGKFEEGTIGQWTRDALQVIDYATKGPLLVVGSSMGGWIAFQVALQRAERVMGIIGIAAAPDFTRDIKACFSDQQKQELLDKGFFSIPSEYGDDLIFTKKLIDDGEAQSILDTNPSINVPVYLIQGRLDQDVPWTRAEDIKRALHKASVEIIYIEDGDHRLSREQDLILIDNCVQKFV